MHERMRFVDGIAMKVSELLVKADWKRNPKARNLAEFAWVDGYMLVRFQLRGQLYVFGPEIPQNEEEKILKNPFPDRIFTTNIKNKFKCFKVPKC
jgi:hypothetical protein